MKKLLCLMLVCAMFFSSCAFAAPAPAGFDLSAFDGELYEISTSDDGSASIVDPLSRKPYQFDPGLSSSYYCSFYPDVLVRSNRAVFRLWCNFYAGRSYDFDTMIIAANGSTYTVTGLQAKGKELDNGEIANYTVILTAGGLKDMIADIAASEGVDASVTLQGLSDSYRFDLTPEMARGIGEMYAAFLTAGGADFFDAVSESAYTVSSSEGGAPSAISGKIGQIPSRTEGGFNLSLFESDGAYEVDLPTSDKNGCIDLADLSGCYFDPELSDDYYCVFAPDILLKDSENPFGIFRLWCTFYSKTGYDLNTIKITVGGKTYVIGDVQSDTSERDNGDIRELCVIVIGDELLALMEDLQAGRNGAVVVELIGERGRWQFEMADSMKAAILDAFDDFVKAGGTNPDFLSQAYEHDFTVEGGDAAPADEPEPAPAREPEDAPSKAPETAPEEAPQGFDLSLFSEGYTITEPTESQPGYVDVADRSPTCFDPGYSQDYYCCLTPDIMLRTDGSVQFRLWSYFYAKREFDFDEMTIAFPDASYTIQSIRQGVRELDNGDTRLYMVVNIGTDLSGILERIRDNPDGAVTVALTGEADSYKFTMTASMKQTILDMYDLFLKAGGGAFLNADTENRYTLN